MTFRVAILGAGAMGSIMARDVYPGLADQVDVGAVIDRHPERSEPLAAALGARTYASLEQALDAEELDGIDIRLQHAAHADAAIAALERGLHVLVEKPLALTIADCRAIAAAADRADRVVAIAENYPHLAAVRAARAAIDAGELGEVLAVRSTRAYTLDGVWATTAWRQGSVDMSGLLWDQGTHHTSMLRALAGEIRAVSARSAGGVSTPGAEVHTIAADFESGALGDSLYCWGTPGRPSETEGLVLGSTGAIELSVSYDTAEGLATLDREGERRSLSSGECYYDSHVRIVEDWVRAIHNGVDPVVTLASATADVAVVIAARESIARGGAEVALAEVLA